MNRSGEDLDVTTVTRTRCIRTRRDGSWTIVMVETDQPGLYGLGSASDRYNPAAVVQVIDQLYGPMVQGREVGDIEDIWQSLYTAGYWRNGAVTNTALAAIDVALWDIKGKEAGLPVHQLLGGKARSAVPCYAHASGGSIDELIDDVERYVADGWPVIRCQVGPYGGGGFLEGSAARLPRNPWDSRPFDEEAYLSSTPAMFEALRERFGPELKLTHDVHSHLSPQNAVQLARLLEPYRLFFVEDILPPEQIGWYRNLRQVTSTPQAVGELFVHPHEWRSLISEQLIDFVRTRISKIGGITAAIKIAHLAEAFGVRTAWQEGGDNDPVNLAAALQVDLSCWNFGIQEENNFRPEELAAFPGAPVIENGYWYPTNSPGLGIDIDEVKAAALLGDIDLAGYHAPYGTDRKADGTAVRP
ncbi:enolase C-terminal domain-like protein [Microlunatus speluncae]|uniref:enolase C-terminal domain-like protein n=1 Tax=Microlunatus speluncae TaxID=2594267 RepID=UPI0012666EA6|nr:enolase C-terminal domain-like protein [Microlunatus speluncae]